MLALLVTPLFDSRPAAAVTLIVNSTLDAPDANPGDGVCATSAGACTLRAAIQEANTTSVADTVQLPAGTYPITIAPATTDPVEPAEPPEGTLPSCTTPDSGEHEGDHDITCPVTIAGAGSVDTIIDAQGLDRAMDVHLAAGGVTLSGLTLRNGNTFEDGGALRSASAGLLLLNDVSVTDSTSAVDGGGIHALTGTLRLMNGSMVSGNDARYGGGIFSAGALSPTGVVSRVEIADSTIAGNASFAEGGGIYVDHEGTLTATNTAFTQNTAGGSGGGVAVVSKTALVMTGGTVSDNLAGGDGGGVYADAERSVTIHGVAFTGNTAGDPIAGEGSGGGLWSAGSGAVTVRDSALTENSAVGPGGGLAISNGGTVIDTTIADNSAGHGGGGIWTAGGAINLLRLTVTGNEAGGDGGGIESEGSADFRLTDTLIAHNTALNGGGFANAADGSTFVSQTTFWDNRALLSAGSDGSGLGGGVYSLGDASAEYENVTISANFAQARGGGLYVDADAPVHVVHATISRNSSPVGSGIGGPITSINFPVEPSEGVTVKNTIVAGNLLAQNCSFAIGSEGGNLDGDTGCYFIGPKDRPNVDDSGLDAVADNGGPTLTMALRQGSLAIDGGVSPCTDTDQRGVQRPQNAICDSGAFESEGPFPSPDTIPPDTMIVDPPSAVGELATFVFAGTDDTTPVDLLLFECRLRSIDPTEPPEPPDPTAPPEPEDLFVGCVSPWQVAVEGTSTLEVRAIDRAGNVDPEPATHTFAAVTDTTPPQTFFLETPPDPTTSSVAHFTFGATDDLTPPELLVEFECRIDSNDPEAWLECVNPTSFANLSQGSHTVQVRISDEAGNIDPTPATYTWTVLPPVDCDTANITLFASQDAHVDEFSPITNFSFAESLMVRSSAGGNDARTLIEFELPAGLPACDLESATLRLSGDGPSGRTLDAHLVDAAWSESTVTWNTQPTTGALAASATSGSGYREWDVTASVIAMLGGALNHGWLIRDAVEEDLAGAEQAFVSTEGVAVPPAPPQLVLRFESDGLPPPPAPPEPTSPVTVTCGQVLFESTLVGNDLFGCLGEGLVIGAPNIVVDLGGHVISSGAAVEPGEEDGLLSGIRNSGHQNVVLRNGTVQGFGYGVRLLASARYNVMTGLTLESNVVAGIELWDADDGRNGNRIEANTFHLNGIGVALINGSEGTVVHGNDFQGNLGFAVYLFDAHDNEITSNTVNGLTGDPLLASDGGIRLEGSTGNDLVNNTVSDVGDASFEIGDGSHNNRIEGNTGTRGSDSGLSIGDSDGNIVVGNFFHLAGGAAISLSGANGGEIRGNDVRYNPSGIELESSSGNLIEGNDASQVLSSGISIGSGSLGNTIRNNYASHTNATGIAVDGNAVDEVGNPLAGNVIEGNDTSGNLGSGISISGSGHTVTANAAHNNAAWGIQASAGTDDGGGNTASNNGESLQCSGVVCAAGVAPPDLPADTTAPDTMIVTAPANGGSSMAPQSFTFTGSDDQAPTTALRFECRLDAPPDPEPEPPEPGEPPQAPESETWLECGNPTTYNLLQAGEHKFEVRAIDPAGNADLTPEPYTWTVVAAPPGPDSLPPSTTIFDGPDDGTVMTAATFTFSGSDNSTPGPNLTYECRLDSVSESDFVACASPFTYAGPLSTALHTFEVRSVDLGGNVDPTPASYAWTIIPPEDDTVPPETTILSGPDPVTVSTEATFTFIADENGSTFECSLGGSPFAACTSPHTETGLGVASHTFEVRAIDPAGNPDPSPASYAWSVGAAPVPTAPTCGMVVTVSILLTDSLSECSGDGLVVGADAITIDLNGHTIDGTGLAAGIRNEGFDSVTLTNGNIQEFDFGVQLNAGTAGNIVSSLVLQLNQEAGLQLNDADDGTNGNSVRSNTITGNATGLVLMPGTQDTLVLGNTFGASAGEAIYVESASGNRIEGNLIGSTGDRAVVLVTASDNVIIGNEVSLSSDAAYTLELGSNGNRVEANVVSESEAGIVIADSSDNELIGNQLGLIGDTAITLENAHDNLVLGNDVSGNSEGISLAASTGNRIEDNDASGTSGAGIILGDLALGNVIIGNLVSFSHAYGIESVAEVLPESTEPGNLIEANIASSNSSTGIYIDKPGHTITGNTANNNSAWGIYASEGNIDGGGNSGVGNTELAQCSGVRCDGSVPVPAGPPDTIIVDRPPNPTDDRDALFTFTGVDDSTLPAELGFECRLDSTDDLAWVECENPWELLALDPGSHTFEVRAIDIGDNVDPTPATYTWSYNPLPSGVAPDTFIDLAPPVETNLLEAIFTFSSNEPNVTFECSLDSAAFELCEFAAIYAFDETQVGTHTFEVRAIDFEGNIDPTPATHTWTVLGVLTTIESAPDVETTSTTAIFAFSANVADATFECSLDLGPFVECFSPTTYTGLAIGEHVWRIFATDPETGHTEAAPVEYEWEVIPDLDLTPPETVITGGPDADAANGDLTFTFTGTDNVTTPDGLLFQCSLDSALDADFGDCTSPATYPNPDLPDPVAPGDHTFYVRALDFDGNVDATPAELFFTYAGDTVAPSVTISSGPPAETLVIDVAFTFVADDPFATFECSLDGILPFESCESPHEVQGVLPGVHELAVRGVDLSGNTGPTATYGWTVIGPPETTIDSAPAVPTTSATASFEFSSDQPGTFACSLDGLEAVPCTSPVTYVGLALGEHSFEVVATNPATGLTDPEPAVFDWTIDPAPPGEAPETTLVETPAALTASTDATFTFTANKLAPTFECSLDGGTFVACTSPWSYSGLADGTYTFEVRAIGDGLTDLTPATFTWTVDGTTVYDASVACGDTLFVRVRLLNGLTDCAGDGLVIGANGVTVDLNAFTVDGNGGGLGVGVRNDGFDGVEISNGTIQQFLVGVAFSTDAQDGTVSDLVLQGNLSLGIHLLDTHDSLLEGNTVSGLVGGLPGSDAGILLEGSTGNTLLTNDISATGDAGIVVSALSHANRVEGNVLTSTGDAGIQVLESDANEVVGNTVRAASDSGIALDTAHDGLVSGNDVRLNAGGIGLTESNGNLIEGNDASESGGNGIALGDGSSDNVVTMNTASQTGGHGIYVPGAAASGTGNLIDANTASGNTSDGIHVAQAEHTISSNTANDNLGWGIFAAAGNVDGGDNAASGNGQAGQCTGVVCSANTPAGTSVTVEVAPMTLTFDQVLTAGETTVATSTTAPELPATYLQVGSLFYDVTTTANFSATVVICVDYNPADFADPSTLELLHFVDDAWTDVTTSNDTVAGVICGVVPSLSPFAVATPPDTTAPETTITSGPPVSTISTDGSFAFSADEAGATFQCSMDGADFAGCTSPAEYTGLATGGHSFAVQATDAAGNVDTTPATTAWTIEAPPPPADCGTAKTLTASADAWINQDSPSSNKGTDSTLKVMSKSRDALRALVQFSIPAPPDGCIVESATLRLYASSYRSGRTLQALQVAGSWTERGVTWNNQPPTAGPAATTTSGSGWRSWDVSAQLQAIYDAGANHGFLIRDAVETNDAEQQFNSREKSSRRPTLVIAFAPAPAPDTTAPETTVSGGPEDPTTSTSASFQLGGSDDTTAAYALAYQCSLDAAAFAACTSPASYSGLAPGTYTFATRAVDGAGNVDPTPATHTWTVEAPPPDTTDPETAIDSAPPATSTSASATFSFSANEAGSSFVCALDGASTTCTSPVEYSGLATGPHSFGVHAVDAARNADETPATYAWTVETPPPDTTQPETTIDSAPPATSTSASATFSFSASEPASFFCGLDGAAPTTCTSPIEYSGLAAGSHTFAVHAVDAVGNADQTPATYAWTVDETVDCGSATTLIASADGWIDQASSSQNKGDDSSLKVRSKGSSDNIRALVLFPLPTVPAGCVVQSATLRLYSDSPKDGRTLQALQVAGSWTENGVTWSNQPATTGTAATTSSGYGWRDWNVAAQAQAIYDTGANYGFLIRDATEGQDAEQSFMSREKGENQPTLVISFVAASASAGFPAGTASCPAPCEGSAAVSASTFAIEAPWLEPVALLGTLVAISLAMARIGAPLGRRSRSIQQRVSVKHGPRMPLWAGGHA